MDQNLRIESLDKFKNKTAEILIASNVVARGIDIDSLSHVFNYDVPNNPEDYVHRIGRTGRAGKKGIAYTFYDDKDHKSILLIEKLTKKKVKKIPFDKIVASKKIIQNKNPINKSNDKYKDKSNPNLLPDEDFLNFRESGKIPEFLN